MNYSSAKTIIYTFRKKFFTTRKSEQSLNTCGYKSIIEDQPRKRFKVISTQGGMSISITIDKQGKNKFVSEQLTKFRSMLNFTL